MYKAKSKKIFQLKYLLLVPMVLGMLSVYRYGNAAIEQLKEYKQMTTMLL